MAKVIFLAGTAGLWSYERSDTLVRMSVNTSGEKSETHVRQVDQPRMIGTVGSILGEENVNVSFMSVGRIAPRKEALMTIGVDEQPSKESLKRIGEVPSVEEFVYLKL
ncbi:hypothetical protein AgCh_014144 [Apium graveolens]